MVPWGWEVFNHKSVEDLHHKTPQGGNLGADTGKRCINQDPMGEISPTSCTQILDTEWMPLAFAGVLRLVQISGQSQI